MSAAAECPRSLVVERVFPHPQEKLWRALTNGSLLEQWMMPNNFAPVVGHKFQFRTDPKPNWDGVVDGEVLVVEPIDRLSYTWGTGGAKSGMQWVVEWTLTPNAGGTHVRMEQSGFSPEQKGNYNGAKYGWNLFFNGLERVVAEGEQP
ncbi:MAG TPA: SRPBCC domain-containing protein [Acidobacteriaceae bacterium]